MPRPSKQSKTSKEQRLTIAASTKVELALRIAVYGVASEGNPLPSLRKRPNVRSLGSGNAARTIYYWTLGEGDSREGHLVVRKAVRLLHPQRRRLTLLRTKGVRVEVVLSLQLRSDFGGIELAAEDQALLTSLKLPLDVHIVANVDGGS